MLEQPQITTYNKIGFHVGPGTNQELLEQWINGLSTKSIPFFLTVAGDFTLLDNLARRFPEPNTLVFQLSPQNNLDRVLGEEFNFQAADFYTQHQGQEYELAEKYWQLVKEALSPQFMRERVWLELPGNLSLSGSLEAQQTQADWLGEFTTALARQIVKDEYRIAFFGWQSGQPDPHIWHTDGMLRLLHFCQQYPQTFAFSFHEFSNRLDTISPNESGSGIGRFRYLWQTCHEQHIIPPPIFITEWGWTRTRIPNPGTALAHIEQVNEELYAKYPEVYGVALWTLDREAGPVADLVADLIPSLVDLTSNRMFDVTTPDPVDLELAKGNNDHGDIYGGSTSTAGEDPVFTEASQQTAVPNILPGNLAETITQQGGSFYESTPIQQSPIAQKDLLDNPLTTAPVITATHPQQIWLKAPDPNELELLLGSDNALAAVHPDAHAGDILLWYRPEQAAITDLFHLQEAQSNILSSRGTAQLQEHQVLAHPVTSTDIQHYPPLAQQPLPQVTQPAQNLTDSAHWEPLRNLILAWNPDFIFTMASWTGVTETDLYHAAVAAARQIQESNGRFQALTALINSQHIDKSVLTDLRQDRDWHVRRAARHALGETDTLDTLLTDADTALQANQPQDVRDMLGQTNANWQSSGSKTQRTTAHTLLAQAYEALGNQEQAREHWQQAATLAPDHPAAFAGIDRNTTDDHLDEAEKFMRALRDQQKDAAGPAAGLAAIAQRRNQFETAVNLLTEAAERAITPGERQRLEDQRKVIIQYMPQAAAPPAPNPAQILDPRQKKLYDILCGYFSANNLRDLAFALNIDTEDLRQDRRNSMAYDLIRTVANQSRLGELERLVKQHRPATARLFQDSVTDLIAAAQSMLVQYPEKAIRFLEDQEDEWQSGAIPELATIHTILAQAYTAIKQLENAYRHWQRKAALQPDAADACSGMANTAPDDQLDAAEQWLRDLQAQHPDATGPAFGLAAVARRRGHIEEAANLLANAPTANPVQQRQMAHAAAEVRARANGTVPAAAVTASTERPLTTNTLNSTLNDLAATTNSLGSADQLSILRAFIQQTMDLPTLSPTYKRLLKLRSTQVLTAAEQQGRITPSMLAELHLPALDYLFITQPDWRRALIRTVTYYRQQGGRRLVLYLRELARQQIRHQLAPTRIMQIIQDSQTAQAQAYEEMKTAVFQQGTAAYRDQSAHTFTTLLNNTQIPTIKQWRLAAHENMLRIHGNLSHDVPPAVMLRLEAYASSFWPLVNDLLHNQESSFRYLDSWGRFRRSPLPDAITSTLLYAFYANIHLPYNQETAETTLRNLNLAAKVRQLDYRAYLDFAQNLLHDEDLGFDSLDDVALFLYQIATGDIILDLDPTESTQTPLYPPLQPYVRLQPEAIDTVLDLPQSVSNQMTAALNAGNHLILIGPPGTGKTTMAQDISRLAHDTGCNRGYTAVTATADWTTFDTVGGYMPESDNQLVFSEGIVLRAIRAQKWLIIDEINRADIDKAFGELFTVLSGQPVTLPYLSGHQPIRILPAGYPSQSEQDYVIPPTWRVIGTMNVYDKASLFEMSYAFMRRFAFVDIGIPDSDIFSRLITRFLRQANLPDTNEHEVVKILNEQLFQHEGIIMHNRPLGPAIARDMIRYLGQRLLQTEQITPDDLAEAFLLYAIPQFDGLEETKIQAVFLALSEIFVAAPASAQAIRRRLRELFPQYTNAFPAEETFA